MAKTDKDGLFNKNALTRHSPISGIITGEDESAQMTDNPKKSFAQLMAEAKERFEAKRYDLAIKILNDAICGVAATTEEMVRAIIERGRIHGAKGDWDSAIADFSGVTRLEPDYAEAFYYRGVMYGKKGDRDREIADYNEAVRLRPDYIEALHNRGVAYGQKGEFDLALADLNEEIRLNPDSAVAFNSRGNVFIEKGEFDLALADFNQAIKLKPDYAIAFHNRVLAIARRDAEWAKREYEKTLNDQIAALKQQQAKEIAALKAGQAKELVDFMDEQTKAIDEMRAPFVDPEKIRRYFAARERKYRMELGALNCRIFSLALAISIVLLLFIGAGIGGAVWRFPEEKIQWLPLAITASVFAALAVTSPLFWHLRNLFARRRTLQMCIEDYARKQVVFRLLLLGGGNEELRRFLVESTHRHFATRSAAELLAAAEGKAVFDAGDGGPLSDAVQKAADKAPRKNG